MSTLDDVREWLGRYIRTVADADLDLLALWCAHTHVAMEVYSSPRLLIDSPMPGSGKTTCLEHLARLCLDPVQMAAVSSSALLVRLLQSADGEPLVRTLLIDEADRTLRPDKDGVQDLIAILNSGYKRGATRPVLVPVKGGGWESKEMATFAPVAIAGNNPSLPDDTRTRTIRVLLLPDLDGTAAESDWELIEEDAQLLGDLLGSWAEKNRELIAGTRPEMPAGVIGRFREKWQPLARVAAAAGGRWPQVVVDLALADVEQVRADREDGAMTEAPHILLLRNLRDVWPEGEDFVQTADLVEALKDHFPDHWGASDRFPKGLTIQRFGRMMSRSFGVNTVRATDGNRERGYLLSTVRPVMGRLGMGVSNKPDEPVEAAEPDRVPSGSAGLAGSSGYIATPQGEPVPVETLPIAGPEIGTCSVCRLPMEILDPGQTTHPACSETTTRRAA
ncbi:DUF3631 domain-containing protein [Tessaracoccus defluvii]